MTPSETRAQLRAILRLLISERDDAQLLYIPRGEAGIRRMIRHLIALRAPGSDMQLERDIAAFVSSDKERTP